MVNERPRTVIYLTEPLSDFEEEYSQIRSKEGRWLNDDQVKVLPELPASHPLSKEWKMRADMLSRFSVYINEKQPKNVLDIGCGNGWMTHKISDYCEKITGLDVGREELEQANRCFGNESTSFVCCSDWRLLPEGDFDLIYFAGSFHYFELNDAFWKQLKRLLKPGGEIHILETRFYSEEAIDAAKNRSDEYFRNLGLTGNFYRHLSYNHLPEKTEILYKPSWLNKIFRNRSPFPWARTTF